MVCCAVDWSRPSWSAAAPQVALGARSDAYGSSAATAADAAARTAAPQAARSKRRPRMSSLSASGPRFSFPRKGEGVWLRLFRTCIGVATDAPDSHRADASAMKTSYSVVWREGEGPLARGKLEFLSKQLRLDGMGPTSSASREIDYGDLAGVRVGRAAADR